LLTVAPGPAAKQPTWMVNVVSHLIISQLRLVCCCPFCLSFHCAVYTWPEHTPRR